MPTQRLVSFGYMHGEVEFDPQIQVQTLAGMRSKVVYRDP
jgi:hypothetical protein